MIDIKNARKTLDLKFEKERSLSLNRFNQAALDAGKIIQCIITKYSPQKVYQWGSLLNFDRFNKYSDIDIAIEGITDPETYYQLFDDVLNLTSFEVDIVQIEKIEPEFANLIRQSGKVVYECEK